jgi:glutamine synthetase
MLKAGLDGIKLKKVPPKPVEENVYDLDEMMRQEKNITTLPGSLGESIEELKKCELVMNLFGEEQFKRYIEAKKKEWNEYRIQVTQWEIDNYLERT